MVRRRTLTFSCGGQKNSVFGLSTMMSAPTGMSSLATTLRPLSESYSTCTDDEKEGYRGFLSKEE